MAQNGREYPTQPKPTVTQFVRIQSNPIAIWTCNSDYSKYEILVIGAFPKWRSTEQPKVAETASHEY
jgi:hypothetical protein